MAGFAWGVVGLEKHGYNSVTAFSQSARIMCNSVSLGRLFRLGKGSCCFSFLSVLHYCFGSFIEAQQITFAPFALVVSIGGEMVYPMKHVMIGDQDRQGQGPWTNSLSMNN